MRTFAEYRKEQLQEVIEEITLQEGLLKHFEILRINLLEAIKLPFVPQQTILAEVQYDQSRKEDYLINSAFINEIIDECQKHFYDELMAEADAAFNAGNALNQFKVALNKRVSDFIRDLRQVVAAAMDNARDTGEPAGAPAAGAPAGGAPAGGAPAGGAPAGGGSRLTGRQPQNVSMGTSFDVGAGMGPSGVSDNQGTHGVDREGNPLDPYPRWRADRGVIRPKQGNFQPAAMGDLRPSDGFFAGLGRVARRVTRPLRRVWHGDPTRQMAKEHHEALNTLFLENWQSVSDLVDKFEAEIQTFIGQQLDQIIAKLGVQPSPTPDGSGAPGAEAPGGPQDAIPVGGTVTAPDDVATGAPAVDKELDQAAQQASNYAQKQGQPPEEAVEEAVSAKLLELVADGAKRIGIIVDVSRGRSGGLSVTPDSFKNAEGQPIGKWGAIRNEVVKQMFAQMRGMDSRYGEYSPEALTAKGDVKKRFSGRTGEIERLLGITGSPKGPKKQVFSYLSALEMQMSGRQMATKGKAPSRGVPTAATSTATLEPADALAVGDEAGKTQVQPMFSDAKGFVSYLQQNNPDILKWIHDNEWPIDDIQVYLDNNDTPEAALASLISDYEEHTGVTADKIGAEAPAAGAEAPVAGAEAPVAAAGTEELPVATAGTEELPVATAGTEELPVATAGAEEIPAAVIATIDDYKDRMAQKGVELDVPDDIMKKLLSQFAQIRGETLGELGEEDAKEFFGNHLVPWVAENHPEWMQKWEVDEESVMDSVQKLEQQLREKGYTDSKIRPLVKGLMDTLDSEGPEATQKKIDHFTGEARKLAKSQEGQGESEEQIFDPDPEDGFQNQQRAAMRKEAFARKLKNTMKSLFS